jgi:DNA polymerase (family 10)
LGLPIVYHETDDTNFGTKLFYLSASEEFLQSIPNDLKSFTNESEVFDFLKLEYTSPETRESARSLEMAKNFATNNLLSETDLVGLVHCHTTYSDGLHTLKQMADACMHKGLKYMVVTDHSRSAFYAGGLSIERVEMQWREIDSLNPSFSDFKILKGIESDILGDGSLDYPDDILSGFDVVIASIHSNLKMDIEKATQRIISAIENKYTTMLGHPTGRLLLSREGYPLDFKKVIDACAANEVIIELNSNPQRLDLDFSWLEYCMQKNVQISINPDAHSIGQIEYLKYGVLMARKGGLETKFCWNAKIPSSVK